MIEGIAKRAKYVYIHHECRGGSASWKSFLLDLYVRLEMATNSRGTLCLDEVVKMLDIECDDEEDLSEDEFEGYVDQGMDDRYEEGVVDGYAHEVIEDEAVGENVQDANTYDSLPQYTQTPGLTKHMQGKRILDFFKLFLDDSVIDVIVCQTNHFADQFLSGQVRRPFSRMRAWKSTNSNG